MERQLSSSVTHLRRPLLVLVALLVGAVGALAVEDAWHTGGPWVGFAVVVAAGLLLALQRLRVSWQLQQVTADDRGLYVGRARMFVPFAQVASLRRAWWRPAHVILDLHDPHLLGGRVRFMPRGLYPFSMWWESEELKWLRARVPSAAGVGPVPGDGAGRAQ